MRLIDADALLELLESTRYGHIQRLKDLINNAPTVQREGLTKGHDVYEVGDYDKTYPISLARLENFAKEYHKAMISAAPLKEVK